MTQAVPDVSVIIPAYNALPYLHRSLESLVSQTLGTERMEVVVVDDGSTDGTGEALDEWADRHPGLFRVVHATASGGPAAPRNTGLDLARGRYVYFLDADDYLGSEALERLLATADEEGSDIVMGKMVATSDRAVPSSMYRRNDLDADLFTSRVWWTLAALKLFRRSLIEDNNLRFPTNFPNASDQPFTGIAYLRARKISVLSDYDFYHVVLRDDGQHVTLSGPITNELDVAEAMCELIEAEVIDIDKRAPLLTRHLQIDVALVMSRLAGVPRPEQDAVIARVVALVRRHLDADVQRRLTPDLRVVYHLAERGLRDEFLTALLAMGSAYRVVVDGEHAYAQLPFFRDQSVGVPDELYDVTDRLRTERHVESFECHEGGRLTVAGAAGIVGLRESTEVNLVFRSREDPSIEHIVAATRGEADTFRVDTDLLIADDGAPLAEGTWEVHVQVRREGVSTMSRLSVTDKVDDEPEGDQLTDSFAWAATDAGDGWTVGAYLSRSGRLRLDVKWRRGASGKQFTDWELGWDDTDLVVRGHLVAPRSAAPVRFVLRGPGGEARRVPAEHDGAMIVGRVPMTDLSEGIWELRLRVGRPPAHRPVTIRVEQELATLTWRDGLGETKVQQGQGPTVTLEVTSMNPGQKASRLLRSMTGR